LSCLWACKVKRRRCVKRRNDATTNWDLIVLARDLILGHTKPHSHGRFSSLFCLSMSL
jgi:uncharacterized membrane protein